MTGLTSERLQQLRARARTEPPSVLAVWAKDKRRAVRQIADAELRKRQLEQRDALSLTGVVPPLDAA